MRIENIREDHPDYQRIVGALNEGNCPDCRMPKLVPGPRGGLSRNVACDNCGSRFNVAPWYFDQPPHNFAFVQRIIA